jgi:hypothetical protein
MATPSTRTSGRSMIQNIDRFFSAAPEHFWKGIVRNSMKIFSFRRRQLLPISIEEAWAFSSSPHNLAKITPSKMNFQILEIGGGERLHVGQLIRYNVNIHPMARVEWITEITHVNEPFEFTDIQKRSIFVLATQAHFPGGRFRNRNDG